MSSHPGLEVRSPIPLRPVEWQRRWASRAGSFDVRRRAESISFLETLELEDVTLVGNDSGGALSQFLIDTAPPGSGGLC